MFSKYLRLLHSIDKASIVYKIGEKQIQTNHKKTFIFGYKHIFHLYKHSFFAFYIIILFVINAFKWTLLYYPERLICKSKCLLHVTNILYNMNPLFWNNAKIKVELIIIWEIIDKMNDGSRSIVHYWIVKDIISTQIYTRSIICIW